MKKSFRLISLCVALVTGSAVAATALTSTSSTGTCAGRFPNLVKDVCWLCMFPVRIGSMKITIPGQSDNHDSPPPLLCTCPAPPPIFKRIGIGVSYWEPARVAEVVRTPMCSPTLNGKILGKIPGAIAGTHGGQSSDADQGAFYQVHWFVYPIMNWLGIAIATGACLKIETFDLAYMSELDPLWDDDELTFLTDPESILFANPISQAACAADAVAASTTKFGIDQLFWCSGSQGSVYPIDGNISEHHGGVDSSLDAVHRLIFKMHRSNLALDTSTRGAMCFNLPQPVMRKTQYKQQMLYPIAQSKTGYGLGAASVAWGAGKEFPYRGEDFAYLIWRKRICCAW